MTTKNDQNGNANVNGEAEAEFIYRVDDQESKARMRRLIKICSEMDLVGKLEAISPVEARRLLAEQNYGDNRPISESTVDLYCRQMVNDLWQINGEPVILDVEEKILNGQHRLAACAKSNMPFAAYVIRGVPTEAFSTMDQGKLRTAGAIMKMYGHKNATMRAALARKIYLWETEGSLTVKVKLSADELEIVANCYAGQLERSIQIGERIRKELSVEGAMVSFAHWLFSRAKPARADAFMEAMHTLIADYPGDPAPSLARKISREAGRESRRGAKRRWNQNELLGLFVRCWNAREKGEPLAKPGIKMDGDGGFKVPAVRGLSRANNTRGARSGIKDYQEILAGVAES